MCIGRIITGNRPILKLNRRNLMLIFFIQLAFTCFSIIAYHVKQLHERGEALPNENASTKILSYLSVEPFINADSLPKIQPFVTVVTAFYQFPKSKHSINEYESWLPNLFITVSQPMVVFTDMKLALTLKSFRRADTLTSIVTNYSTPWEIPVIQKLAHIFKNQAQLDPENFRHSPDLYAVWAAKPWLMNFTAFWNPFRTKYFMWIDAGAFRYPSYRFYRWPHSTRLLEALVSQNHDSKRLLLGLVNPIPVKFCKHIPSRYDIMNGPIVEDLIQGTMFAGCPRTLHWWAKTYFETLELFAKNGFFVGKDQSIMNAIAFSQPNKVRVLTLFKVNCGDPWFAFGPVFADPSDNVSSIYTCFPKNLRVILFPLDEVCIDSTNTVS